MEATQSPEESGQKTSGAEVVPLLVCEWVGGSFVVKNQELKSTQESEDRGQGAELEFSRRSSAADDDLPACPEEQSSTTQRQDSVYRTKNRRGVNRSLLWMLVLDSAR
ncbi:Hypothetical predicted protein [Xyrichtys novacula]|uniref:Uncharacterized protein n=1 Tax=Xyrichtys novacula TaxID=13765 RepID=A0AAV1H2Y5_XYRNO|nr:Hypothetical predicted protein [Xyrichtys novacula]